MTQADTAGDVMLVGSIPHKSIPQAMNMFGPPLAQHLQALPDGEVGWRRFWITRVHFQVLAIHPDLEVIQQPRRDNGIERIYPHDATDNWNFKVRDGVDKIVFGHPGWRLGFYQDAANSYHFFRDLKDKGLLPESVRFQVSIPSAVSAIPPRVMPHKGDLEKVRPGYIDAVRAEVLAMLDVIPAKELAIQWDCSSEMQDVYGGIAGTPAPGGIERNLPQINALSRDLPDDVMLGFHLCFGTLGGWPRFAPDSTDKAVELANAFIEGSGRRVDWMHIPLLDRTDEAYYAPLAALRPDKTRLYLGMIHSMNTYEQRLALARKYVPDFGVAAYCGFGRRDPDELQGILDDHVRAVELLQRSRRA
ncbi:hypothetical protein PY365_08670 [Roseiarcaceae bacterium H3SJ34-1]|uniref:hypothetical protein n=1 Tax=Terripilifer ovatus TaxID=3032367 RepID=UPI003AB99792|nr:hypothetical protein [Roseiarcaceae bacterium H3SJ34-1]